MKEINWRTRCRWENNIKIDLKKIRWMCLDWIDLLAGCLECGTEPSESLQYYVSAVTWQDHG